MSIFESCFCFLFLFFFPRFFPFFFFFFYFFNVFIFILLQLVLWFSSCSIGSFLSWSCLTVIKRCNYHPHNDYCECKVNKDQLCVIFISIFPPWGVTLGSCKKSDLLWLCFWACNRQVEKRVRHHTLCHVMNHATIWRLLIWVSRIFTWVNDLLCSYSLPLRKRRETFTKQSRWRLISAHIAYVLVVEIQWRIAHNYFVGNRIAVTGGKAKRLDVESQCLCRKRS